MSDQHITCSDCGGPFVFTESERQFYETKGLSGPPKRCKNCRAARKADPTRGAAGRGAGGGPGASRSGAPRGESRADGGSAGGWGARSPGGDDRPARREWGGRDSAPRDGAARAGFDRPRAPRLGGGGGGAGDAAPDRSRSPAWGRVGGDPARGSRGPGGAGAPRVLEGGGDRRDRPAGDRWPRHGASPGPGASGPARSFGERGRREVQDAPRPQFQPRARRDNPGRSDSAPDAHAVRSPAPPAKKKVRGEKPKFDVTCIQCGTAAQVPFRPIEGRDVFCQPCYQARRGLVAPPATATTTAPDASTSSAQLGHDAHAESTEPAGSTEREFHEEHAEPIAHEEHGD